MMGVFKKEAERVETTLYTYEKRGDIIYCWATPVEPTFTELNIAIDALQELCPEGNALLLLDPSAAPGRSREQREYMISRMSTVVAGIAVINPNSAARLMISMITRISDIGLPIKVLKDEASALDWLNTIKATLEVEKERLPSDYRRVELKSHIFERRDSIIHCWVTSEPPCFSLLKEACDVVDELKGDNSKAILVVDPTEAIALNAAQRAYVTQRFSKSVEIMAIVDKTVVVKIMHKLLTKIDRVPIPMKLFKSYEEAVAWAEDYRDQGIGQENIA